MISGRVSIYREAVVQIALHGAESQRADVESVVDTGFNGFLTLPRQIIDDLGFPFQTTSRAELADGTIVEVDYFLGSLEWHGRIREVPIMCSDGDVLIGMSLLYGNRVTIDVVRDGLVQIDPMQDKRT